MGMKEVGTADVVCPSCGTLLPCPVSINAVARQHDAGLKVEFTQTYIPHTCGKDT